MQSVFISLVGVGLGLWIGQAAVPRLDMLSGSARGATLSGTILEINSAQSWFTIMPSSVQEPVRVYYDDTILSTVHISTDGTTTTLSGLGIQDLTPGTAVLLRVSAEDRIQARTITKII